jgi:predicted kinase
MAVLNIYRGLQGSGKSTLASERAALDGGRIVGRDHIRRLIGVNGLGTREQEREVTKIQGMLIAEGLKSGQTVHVDDMNLKSEYVRRLLGFADRFKAGVRVLDLTNVDLHTCIVRDAARNQGKVGEKLIRNNYERFVKGRSWPLPMPSDPVFDPRMMPPEPYAGTPGKPDAVLIDLDGTVALKWSGRDFHDYDDRVSLDLPNEPVIKAVKACIDSGLTPLFVSGRQGNSMCRSATYTWINRYVAGGALWLYMRQPHDNRPDWIVKTEIFDKYIRNSWNVVAAFDDRNQVVDRYREMGLTVFQVAPGDF